MTETVSGTYKIDPDTLETVSKVSYDDEIRGALTSAHPHILRNGDLINYVSVPGDGFTVYKLNASSSSSAPKRRTIAKIPHKRPISPAWIHDFPGTETHIILPETPLYFNLGSMLTNIDTDYIFLDWKPSEGSNLHIVDINTGDVHVVETDPFFAFHWANAFTSEDGTHMYIDGCVYEDPEIVSHLMLNRVRAAEDDPSAKELPPSSLRRLVLRRDASGYALVRASDGSSWHRLSDDESTDFGDFAEFPTVAPSAKGREHRYIWGSAAVRPTNVSNALIKFDTVQKKSMWWHEPGSLPGEPCFIPAPNAASEDDGVLLTVVTQASGSSALVVLYASSMQEVARFECPFGLTTGFHGIFIEY